MNKLHATILAGALCATAGWASAQTTLIYGEAGPNRGVRAEGTQWFVDQVGKLSNGDLKIDVNWGGALFSDKAAVQSLRDGVADLGSVIGVYFPADMIAYGLADLPIPNTDPDRMAQSIAEHRAILAAMERRDPDAAQAHMRDHIRNTARCAGLQI